MNYSLYIFQVQAIDPDLLPLTYSLKGPSGFKIDSTSGIISATGNFDREIQSMYNLTVTAIEKGGLNVSEQGKLNLLWSTNSHSIRSPCT